MRTRVIIGGAIASLTVVALAIWLAASTFAVQPQTSAGGVEKTASPGVGAPKPYYFVNIDASPATEVPGDAKPLFPVCVDGLYGFIDQSGQVVIEPRFLEIGRRSDGLVRAAVMADPAGAGKAMRVYGYLGADGEFAIPPTYEVASDFADGLAAVRVGGRFGFIDTAGQLAITPQFHYQPEPFSCGVAWAERAPDGVARRDGIFGVISRDGAQVTQYKYSATQWTKHYAFREGVSLAVERTANGDESVCFIGTDGRAAVRVDGMTSAAPYDGGVAFVRIGGKWALMDRGGKLLTRPRYDACFNHDAGMAHVLRRDEHAPALITTDGDPRRSRSAPENAPGIYMAAIRCDNSFAEDLAIVERRGRMGYVDRRGHEVIPLQYSWASPFAEGLAAVSRGSAVGFIDHKNQMVIRPSFEGAAPFSEGLAAVRSGGKCGFIDKSGTMVIHAQYDAVGRFICGLAPIFDGEKLGYVDRQGRVVWKPAA